MTRSNDDDGFEAGEAVSRWTLSIGIQCDRLDAVADEAISAQEYRDRGYITTWDDAIHEAQADQHFLFIAARNLVRALDSARLGRLPNGLHDQTVLLRDVLEHWDEYESPATKGNPGRAGRLFREQFPGGHPLRALKRLTDGDLQVAPGLSLSQLRQTASDIRAYRKYPHNRTYPPVTEPKPPYPYERR